MSRLARCAECGGPISVASGRSGKATIKVYRCSGHRTRRNCGNSLPPR
ncbi:MAG: recombinase zinc beta ribbon domain-containing protein [Deltaproteobacteria bacterium]|nr:recombinase zinc beta ribbon domain-containing protein [Deltaproteobacteria bacterium]